NAQLLINLASDPFGSGKLNLFGTVEYEPNRNLIPTAFIWYFEILLIIGVHIAAVVLAHGYLGRVARTETQEGAPSGPGSPPWSSIRCRVSGCSPSRSSRRASRADPWCLCMPASA